MVYKLKIAKKMPTIEEKYEEAFTKYVKEESIKSFDTQRHEDGTPKDYSRIQLRHNSNYYKLISIESV